MYFTRELAGMTSRGVAAVERSEVDPVRSARVLRMMNRKRRPSDRNSGHVC